MIWTKLWNSFKNLKKGEWLIIKFPFSKDEIEIMKGSVDIE